MAVKAHHIRLLRNRPEAMATNYDPNTKAESNSRKRQRDIWGLNSHIYNQGMLEIKNLLLQHLQKSNLEMAELSRQQISRLYMTIENAFSKKLKVKDGEIERIAQTNRELEKTLYHLSNELQNWRYQAQSNEAAASRLHADLEQVLADKKVENLRRDIDVVESCCSGGVKKDEKLLTKISVCKYCREKASSVLLLPCRHLCLCDSCVDDPMVVICPACGVDRSGAFKVNLV